MKGIIISGEFNNIIVRQKNNETIGLGELLICDNHLMQAYDLLYGSQLSQQGLELASGLKMENFDVMLLDSGIRSYILARLKNLATIKNEKPKASKELPKFFSEVRAITKEDVSFLISPKNSLLLGKLRTGENILDVPVGIDGQKALSHHILVCGSTGKGKSNLMRNMLWEALDKDYCGLLILDPHDEYYGRTHKGLKDHQAKHMLAYYSTKPLPGAYTLIICTKTLIPKYFDGIIEWTDAQKEAINAYYQEYNEEWAEAAIQARPLKARFIEITTGVVQRRLQQILGIDAELNCTGCFDTKAGTTTVKDIIKFLREGKKAIIDTSNLPGQIELLIGSIIATELLNQSKNMDFQQIKEMPTASIIIEEAPRVLGVNCPPNIFSTIAREGRKFKTGIIAITQLPSMIPKEILANMNTKIILGMESKIERQAVIDSAPQDLSTDDRTIASLDKGEAIITSSFIPFPLPIKIEEFQLI